MAVCYSMLGLKLFDEPKLSTLTSEADRKVQTSTDHMACFGYWASAQNLEHIAEVSIQERPGFDMGNSWICKCITAGSTRIKFSQILKMPL